MERVSDRTLFVGPAGSGKTARLRERFLDLVSSGVAPDSVLFLAANRKAARTAQEAILRAGGRSLGRVQILTWHAYALGLVGTRYGDLGYTRPPSLLTAPEQFGLVRSMLDDVSERERWGDLAGAANLRGFAEELRELVLRAQDRLWLPEEVVARAEELGRPELAEAGRFFRRYLDQLDSMNLVDHANAVALSVRLLQDHPEIERPEAILVDDYQDVTPAEEALLAELTRPRASLAVAADPESRVFGFRGTSLGPFERFPERFAPVEVVRLEERRRGDPGARAWAFDHLAEEAVAVARECLRLAAQEGVPWGEIAVILRRHGAASRAIRRELDRAGVPFVVMGEDRALAVEPAVRPMLDLVRAAVRPGEREDLLPSVLSSPACGMDSYEVRALRREARLRDSSLAELLAAPPEDLPERLAGPLRRAAGLLEEISRRDAAVPPDEVFWFLWESLDYLRALVEGGEQSGLDAVEAFARQIARFSERRPGARFSDYLEVLAEAEFGPERWGLPEERRPEAVRVLTAHNAVGLEFDAVVVAGCVEGEFPDLHDSRAVLDIRDLGERPGPAERARARLEEERRLFGVAATRARRSVLYTAAREASRGEALAPSRLVERLGLAWGAPPAPDGGLTRDETEAAARRTLADRDAPEAARLAALGALARLPGVDPGTWWYERDWTDPGVPLAREPLLTSYSRLTAYENCPLQYLFQVELGLDPETTHQMLVGIWVHVVIDRCAKGEIAPDEKALVAALEERWDPDIFPSLAVADRRRRDAEQMLSLWLKTDGSLPTLASEVGFSFPLRGALMRGKIDRVVRLGARSVRLIDYKTSRYAKSQAEVEEDLQLASYYLALRRDETLARLGEPAYLELAYLGDSYRGAFMRRGIDVRRRTGFAEEAEERLAAFIDGIRAERFRPAPSADCRFCRFKSLCPVWPEGDEVRL